MMRSAIRFSFLLSALLAVSGCMPAPDEFSLLSERIFVDDSNDTFVNVQNLRASLRGYVAGVPEPLGVYFEYLPSGASVGIHEERMFGAASLLKIPIAMAAYRLQEHGKLDLDQEMTLREDMLDQRFGSLWKKGAGHSLTIHDAIREMIVQSDNTARSVLLDTIHKTDPAAMDEIFDELDIPKEFEGKEAVVSPLKYSSILRSLYLSGALSKEHSAELLDFLSRTPFVDKLQAGVPKGILVAHKIGVCKTAAGQEVSSDCGIIYAPKRPYMLCVMVQANEERARTYIRHISALTYDAVSTAAVERR